MRCLFYWKENLWIIHGLNLILASKIYHMGFGKNLLKVRRLKTRQNALRKTLCVPSPNSITESQNQNHSKMKTSPCPTPKTDRMSIQVLVARYWRANWCKFIVYSMSRYFIKLGIQRNRLWKQLGAQQASNLKTSRLTIFGISRYYLIAPPNHKLTTQKIRQNIIFL